MCDCYKLTSDALKEHNTRFTPSVLWNRSQNKYESRVTIATEKLDSHKRQGPVRILANFCPFCGVKLDEDPISEQG